MPPRVSSGFIALLTLAYVGAFTAFVPLLSLLVPLQAETLSPGDKVGLLSLVTLWGAITASLANLGAGWLSDRTRSRWGRRRPWMIIGLAGVILSYAILARSASPTGLVVGIMAFQLAFNLMFSPMGAVLADVVPDGQKGRVAAFLGLGSPLGTASAVLLTASVFPGPEIRLAVLGALVSLCVLPLILGWKEPPARHTPPPPAPLKLALTRDFAVVWISRFCFQIAASVIAIYMLYYLTDHARYGEVFPGMKVESGLANLMAASTLMALIAGFAGGMVSDRLGRRKIFILAAGGLMASGFALFAFQPAWPAPVIAYLLYGLGFGLYTTVDTALVAQTLPSARHAARDLGVMNLTNTLPGSLAPLLALIALGPTRSDWPSLMLAAAGFSILGGLVILGVRRID